MRQRLRTLVRRARGWPAGDPGDVIFDQGDLFAVNRLLAEHAPGHLLDPDPAAVTPDSAARFVLAALVTRPNLWWRFRRPLANPRFARWVAARPGLSAAAAAAVRAAFGRSLGVRVDRVYDLRRDLRAAFPLGLTPHPQRALYLRWLLRHGTEDLGLTPDECLWWLYEQSADPDCGVEASYRLHPDWQAAVPDALTPAGWRRLKAFLADRYDLHGQGWLVRAALPPQPPVVGPGLNVLAHFKYDSGLQQAAVNLAAAAERAGLGVSRRDLPVSLACDWADRTPTRGLEPYPLTAWVTAVNTHPDEFLPIGGLHPRPGVKRVAVWYWELDELPADWVPRLGWPDEVWAPTRFIADAFRKSLAVPVVPMLPGVGLPTFDPLPRAHFGLPADRFLVLFSFDMCSVLARKNPLGLVAAFRRAFRPDDRAHLCVKVSRGEADPAALAELLALLGTADCYASLHRSEGFGLGLAESMLLGKPVVATGYSGNLDFMSDDTSFLVGHTLVPVGATASAGAAVAYPYQGGRWAEPDVGHAAELLRRVYARRDEAAEVAAKGQMHVRGLLSPEAYSRRVAERVRHLGGGV
jgi:glycosyltransferase involved in cell wall biosynthesis